MHGVTALRQIEELLDDLEPNIADGIRAAVSEARRELNAGEKNSEPVEGEESKTDHKDFRSAREAAMNDKKLFPKKKEPLEGEPDEDEEEED